MKRGRRKLVGEKNAEYDKVTVMFGRHPAAVWFAESLTEFSKLKATEPHRAEFFRASMGDTLAEVGLWPDEKQADFFEQVSNYLRVRKDWILGMADAPRFLLKTFLLFRPKSEPVSLQSAIEDIFQECGKRVDDRWVSRECKKLGYTVQGRGRR